MIDSEAKQRVPPPLQRVECDGEGPGPQHGLHIRRSRSATVPGPNRETSTLDRRKRSQTLNPSRFPQSPSQRMHRLLPSFADSPIARSRVMRKFSAVLSDLQEKSGDIAEEVGHFFNQVSRTQYFSAASLDLCCRWVTQISMCFSQDELLLVAGRENEKAGVERR